MPLSNFIQGENNEELKQNYLICFISRCDDVQCREHGKSNVAIEKTGGKVAEADLKFRDGQGFYKIETIANGQHFYVFVNGENAQIIDMPMKAQSGGKGGYEKYAKGRHHHEKWYKGGCPAECPMQKN